MKPILTFYLLFFISLGFSQNNYRCGCLMPAKLAPVVTASEVSKVYIAPSKEAAVIGTISFGEGSAIYLDEKVTVKEEKERIYAKISLEDGTQGWVNDYPLVLCGQGRVLTQHVSAYKDETHKQADATFQAGEAVVMTEEKDGYTYVYSKDKSRKGWVPSTHLLEGREEVKTALLLQKILADKNEGKRKIALKRLHENVNQGLQMAGFVEASFRQAGGASIQEEIFAQVETPKPAMRFPTPKSENAPSAATQQERIVASPKEKAISTSPVKKETKKTKEKLTPKTSDSPSIQRELPENNFAATTKREIPAAAAPTENKQMVNIDKNTTKEKVAVCTQYYKYTEKLKIEASPESGENLVCYHPALPSGSQVQIALPEGGEIILNVVGKSAKGLLQIPSGTLFRIFGENPPKELQTSFFADK